MHDKNRLTNRWGVGYGDYQRAISLHCHYANRDATAIEALLVDSATEGRTLQLFVAQLDLADAIMPTLGHPVIVQKMQELAALWAGKNQGDIHD